MMKWSVLFEYVWYVSMLVREYDSMQGGSIPIPIKSGWLEQLHCSNGHMTLAAHLNFRSRTLNIALSAWSTTSFHNRIWISLSPDGPQQIQCILMIVRPSISISNDSLPFSVPHVPASARLCSTTISLAWTWISASELTRGCCYY
jgi:hypothetical protein